MIQEYCADVIALYHNKIVLVERLTFPKGYALPGGRRDLINGKLENVISCAIRELKEETGLSIIIDGTLGTYDALGRDPRGPKVSTFVYGKACGEIKDEKGKTKVLLLEINEIDRYKDCFAFDHYSILQDWKKY